MNEIINYIYDKLIELNCFDSENKINELGCFVVVLTAVQYSNWLVDNLPRLVKNFK